MQYSEIDRRIAKQQSDMESIHGVGYSSGHALYALCKEEIEEFEESVQSGFPDINELFDIAILARSGARYYNPTRQECSLTAMIFSDRFERDFTTKANAFLVVESLNIGLDKFWKELRQDRVSTLAMLEILGICRASIFVFSNYPAPSSDEPIQPST